MVQAALAGVPPVELLAVDRIGAGKEGGGGIFEEEVRVTDPPAQMVLIEAFTVTTGAMLTVTGAAFEAEQLFASLMVTT